MTKTYIIPVKKHKISDLLTYGLLDVKKYSKTKTIFHKDDRIFCSFSGEESLFGPIYVSNDTVGRYVGDTNDLQIQCEIREPVFIVQYQDKDELVLITDEEYRTIMNIMVLPDNNNSFPPSITGDYELDGLLINIDQKKWSYSDKIIDYLDNKLKENGITDYQIKKNTLILKDDKLVKKLVSADLNEFIDNEQFYKGYLASVCFPRIISKAGLCSDRMKIQIAFPDDAVMEQYSGTIFPIIKNKGRLILSGMSKHFSPFCLLDSMGELVDGPEEISSDVVVDYSVPDSLRFDLSQILINKLLVINGYEIIHIVRIGNCCSKMNIIRDGHSTELFLMRKLEDITEEMTTDCPIGFLLLVLCHNDGHPSIIRGNDFKQSIKSNNPNYLEFRFVKLMYDEIYLQLNWAKSDFSHYITKIWSV